MKSGFKMLISSGCAGRGGDVGRVDEFCKVRNKRRRGDYLLRQIKAKRQTGKENIHHSQSTIVALIGVEIQHLPAQQSVGHHWRKEKSGENVIDLTN